MLTIASFDVGIVNLALVVVQVEDWTVTRVVHLDVSDTTKFEHNRVHYDDCVLGHTKTTTDRVNHFVQERLHLLQAADKVLIERQPIQGLTDVEQVLFMLFRHKAELVSPNSMHKYFQINHLTYEWRKVKTTEIADASFQHLNFPRYHRLQRRHDIADAWCLLLYWLQSQAQQELPRKTRPQSVADTSTTPLEGQHESAAITTHDAEETDTLQSRTEALAEFTHSMSRYVYTGRLARK